MALKKMIDIPESFSASREECQVVQKTRVYTPPTWSAVTIQKQLPARLAFWIFCPKIYGGPGTGMHAGSFPG